MRSLIFLLLVVIAEARYDNLRVGPHQDPIKLWEEIKSVWSQLPEEKDFTCSDVSETMRKYLPGAVFDKHTYASNRRLVPVSFDSDKAFDCDVLQTHFGDRWDEMANRCFSECLSSKTWLDHFEAPTCEEVLKDVEPKATRIAEMKCDTENEKQDCVNMATSNKTCRSVLFWSRCVSDVDLFVPFIYPCSHWKQCCYYWPSIDHNTLNICYS